MLLFLVLLLFRGITAAPIGDSDTKDGLVFPTRPPTTTTLAPTTTVDWKETLVVDETDAKNVSRPSCPSPFTYFSSLTEKHTRT